MQRLQIGIRKRDHDASVGDEGLPAILIVALDLPEILHDGPQLHAAAGELSGCRLQLFHVLQHREFLEQQKYRMLGGPVLSTARLERSNRQVDDDAQPAIMGIHMARRQAQEHAQDL